MLARIDGDEVQLHHAQRPRLDRASCRRCAKALAKLRPRLGLARRRDRGARRRTARRASRRCRTPSIAAHTTSIVYFAVRRCPTSTATTCARAADERRALLGAAAGQKPPAGAVRFSEAFDGRAARPARRACQLGLEGIIGKRTDSRYISRRSPDLDQAQVPAAPGVRDRRLHRPKGARSGLRLAAARRARRRGRAATMRQRRHRLRRRAPADIKARLDKPRDDECPFDQRPAGVKAHWVKPKLVAEVAFTEWTRDGRIRHRCSRACAPTSRRRRSGARRR